MKNGSSVPSQEGWEEALKTQKPSLWWPSLRELGCQLLYPNQAQLLLSQEFFTDVEEVATSWLWPSLIFSEVWPAVSMWFFILDMTVYRQRWFSDCPTRWEGQ